MLLDTGGGTGFEPSHRRYRGAPGGGGGPEWVTHRGGGTPRAGGRGGGGGAAGGGGRGGAGKTRAVNELGARVARTRPVALVELASVRAEGGAGRVDV
ncbi:hypothetical protein, partial [Nocardia asiatica]|uniref:hypothetical protein n=1 Tax=Nocardia asiatica TaxID=209252 RepID=UPI0024563A06